MLARIKAKARHIECVRTLRNNGNERDRCGELRCGNKNIQSIARELVIGFCIFIQMHFTIL